MHTSTRTYSQKRDFIAGAREKTSSVEKIRVKGYTYGFNGMERNDEISGAGNNYDFGARIYDSRLGRWLSIDPHASKYPSQSPYSAFLNSPLIVVDPDGKDNVIYLVVLPGALNANGGKLTVSDINDIVKQTNDNFEALGLKTRVEVFNTNVSENTFDINKLQSTDAVAVLGGGRDEIVNYIEKIDPDAAKYTYGSFRGGMTNPEKSQNKRTYNNGKGGGRVIAVDANALLDYGTWQGVEGKTDKEVTKNTGALLIGHGAGHNSGKDHKQTDPGSNYPQNRTTSVIMDELPDRVGSKDENKDYIKAVEGRFRTNESQDNYKR